MDLNLKNITFIIVTYKSENIIFDCINLLPKGSNIIVIDNSKNLLIKKELENKYDNIEVILSENIGMGAANNIGLRKCKTQFAYVINPDVRFESDTFDKLIDTSKLINDFSILSPINNDQKYLNYKIYKKYNDNAKTYFNVDEVDGFSMLINKNKFKDEEYFDEKIFLYLENTDLCMRVKKNNENIFILSNSKISHLGASSTQSNNIELLRNWHWMWSKFYFNKKHYGFLNAISKIILNLSSSIIKIIIFSIIFQSYKKKIYQMRLSGLFNSIIGKSSWYRIDD